MNKVFEDEFSGVQGKMIQACLEYVESRAEYVYIYASCEPPCISGNFFYKINGELLKKHKLGEGYDVSGKRQFACLDVLTESIKELREICRNYETDMPTEIKIIYDVTHNKVDAAYRYDCVYTKTRNKTSQDVVEEWFEKIKAEDNMNSI